MKKLLFILLLLPAMGQAQYYTGLSYQDTYSYMKQNKLCRNDMDEGTSATKDWGEFRYVSGISDDGQDQVTAFFKDSRCKFTTLKPLTESSFKSWVEMFNQKFVMIDPMSWRDFDGGTYWDIKLKFTDKEEPYFLIE